MWTCHATRYAANMRRHGAGTGHRLLTRPTNMPDALQAAEETLGIMTKQVFQLEYAVHKSNPDVPAAREHTVFSRGHAPVEQPQGAPPERARPNARRRQDAKRRKAPPHRPDLHPSQSHGTKLGRGGSRRPVRGVRYRCPSTAALRIRHGRGPPNVDMGRG